MARGTNVLGGPARGDWLEEAPGELDSSLYFSFLSILFYASFSHLFLFFFSITPSLRLRHRVSREWLSRGNCSRYEDIARGKVLVRCRGFTPPNSKNVTSRYWTWLETTVVRGGSRDLMLAKRDHLNEAR